MTHSLDIKGESALLSSRRGCPVPEGLLNFLFLESSNGIILLKEVSYFDCFFNFCLKYLSIQCLKALLDQKFEFLGVMDFSFDCLYYNFIIGNHQCQLCISLKRQKPLFNNHVHKSF